MPQTGFSNPILSSQSTFRAILDAFARPGSVQPIAESVDAPAPLSSGMAVIALTLCDHDTPVWLDAPLRAGTEVGTWLRFHCGCPLVTNPRDAAFAFASDAAELPAFDAFNIGSDDYPDRSTTIVLGIETFVAGPNLQLMGPGIRGRLSLRANPLPADIAERLIRNRLLFPRGIDLLLAAADAVAGLPRSVRVAEA